MATRVNIAASVQDRLRNQTRSEGGSLQTRLEQFVLSRFFARLAQSDYHDRLILKGAQLFRLWSDQPHRPTRDADFLGYGDPDPEKLALAKLAAQGWDVIDHGTDIPSDPTKSHRTSFNERLLPEVFARAVSKLNPGPEGKTWLTVNQLHDLQDHILRQPNRTLLEANEAIQNLLFKAHLGRYPKVCV